MTHKPIQLKNIALRFIHKTCFQDFSAQINHGDRIGIIGRNGCGKSSMLAMLQGLLEPSEGQVMVPSGIIFGSVAQIIRGENQTISGGQRFNAALTQALALNPHVLLLDEPTNHLDAHNQRSLLRMLKNYQGTLIVVSHDTRLLRECVSILWHIEDGIVNVFVGKYDDYLGKRHLEQQATSDALSFLQKKQKQAVEAHNREQERSAKSKKAHKQENDRVIKGKMKETGSASAGKNSRLINTIKEDITAQLSSLRTAEVITPTFSLAAEHASSKQVVTVSNGSCGYDTAVLSDISFSVNSGERIALLGDNGSGKTTFIKALLNEPGITKTGSWQTPPMHSIGYLDQHYATLNSQKTVLESLQEQAPSWSHAALRRHLNDFLFRKNEEIDILTSQLSGGEKARLCLALIAAKPPLLLILDEITNNLDRETKEHVTNVLKHYPGALVVISHDEEFLQDIAISSYYRIKNQTIELALYTLDTMLSYMI